MIRTMTNEELVRIYKNYMIHDFPDNERKPLNILKNRQKQNQNICLCYVELSVLKGYCILEYSEQSQCLLIDYFAVLPDDRHHGTGTRFMTELKSYFKEWNALLIESECAFDDVSEKRLRFYQKCGAVVSGKQVKLFGVDYELLSIGLKTSFKPEEVKEKLQEIYTKIYPEPFQKLYLKWKN